MAKRSKKSQETTSIAPVVEPPAPMSAANPGYRCLRDICFGYCSQMDGTLRHQPVLEECPEKPSSCPQYQTFSQSADHLRENPTIDLSQPIAT